MVLCSVLLKSQARLLGFQSSVGNEPAKPFVLFFGRRPDVAPQFRHGPQKRRGRSFILRCQSNFHLAAHDNLPSLGNLRFALLQPVSVPQQEAETQIANGNSYDDPVRPCFSFSSRSSPGNTRGGPRAVEMAPRSVCRNPSM